MKVLVYFTQEYVLNTGKETSIVEHLSSILEAESNEDLLKKFDELFFMPRYMLWTVGTTNKRNIKIKNKTMLWYLPESNKPFIEQD